MQIGENAKITLGGREFSVTDFAIDLAHNPDRNVKSYWYKKKLVGSYSQMMGEITGTMDFYMISNKTGRKLKKRVMKKKFKKIFENYKEENAL